VACARARQHRAKGDNEHERTDGQEQAGRQAGKQSNAAERRPAGRQRERTTSPPAVPNGAADKRVFSIGLPKAAKRADLSLVKELQFALALANFI
jgi:hypothetical protein